LHQLLAGKGEIRLGSLIPTRDFNYVADTVGGFMALAQAPKAIGRVVNVGSGREISIGDLIQLIFKVTERQAKIVTEAQRLRPNASEVNRLVCDASLAKELTGWEPKVSLEKGLRRTAEWVIQQQYTPEQLKQFSII
jgi:nucleoside-diphosphate-sugar epimerase